MLFNLDAGLACEGVRSAEPIAEVGSSFEKCAEGSAMKGRDARLEIVSQKCDVEEKRREVAVR